MMHSLNGIFRKNKALVLICSKGLTFFVSAGVLASNGREVSQELKTVICMHSRRASGQPITV